MRAVALFTAFASFVFADSTLAQNLDNGAKIVRAGDNTQHSDVLTVKFFSDRSAFDAANPQAARVNFDDLVGQSAPFGVGSVQIFGGYQEGAGPQVLTSLVDLPASFWFGAQAASTSFVLANLLAQVRFSGGADAVGFDVQCFACDAAGAQPSDVNVTVLNTAGEVIYYTQAFPQGLTGTPAGMPGFLGISANQPIGSVIIERNKNWLFANLRYVKSEASRLIRVPTRPAE